LTNKKIIAVIVIMLVLAAILAWSIWGRGVDPVPETVLIDADYQHPVISMSVTPSRVANQLEIAINPQLQYRVEREDGQIRVILEEGWAPDQEYVLTVSLPNQESLVLDIPFTFIFRSPKELAFNLVAVGDVLLDQLTSSQLRNYDVNYPLARIVDIISSGDLNFANLESPLSDRGERVDKKYAFCAPAYTAEVLTLGGFNAVSLANNHILDYGPEALLDTIALLKEKSINYAGAGANEEQARQGALMDINGVRVALLAYTRSAPAWEYPLWAAGPDKPGTVFYMDEDKMIQDIARARARADIVIVSMHWGNEYTHTVNSTQRELGRLLVDNGADLILGHHPHAPQGIEFYKDKPIAYSLGNFLFYPFGIEICNETVILKARIGMGGVESLSLVPVLMGDSQPYVPEGSELDRMHRVLGGLLDQFGTGHSIQGDEVLIDMP